MKFILLIFIPCFVYATAIHDAVKRVDQEALSLALASGEDINALENGKTALILAIKKHNLEMATKIIEAGADVTLGRPTPMREALLADSAEVAALLMDNKAQLPGSLGISGRGLIYDLLLNRSYNSVGFLLDHGIRFKKSGSLNPFSLALSFAPVSLIETFINHDADINYRDPYLERPLDIALRLERHGVLKLLLDHNVNLQDSHYLEIAVSHKDLQSLGMLVKAGCVIDAKRQNLLLLAVKFGSLEILQELSTAGADLNYRTKKGETALSYAVKHKQNSIINWLLDAKLNPKVDKKSIFYAIDNGELELIKRLADHKIGLVAKNSKGLTPLLYANRVKQFEIAKYLLTLDIDIETKDHLGETALFKSIRFFQDEIMDSLLDKGAKSGGRNRQGSSALQLSIETGNFEAFRKLLNLGIKADKEDVFLSIKKGFERFYVLLHNKFNVKSIIDEKANSLLHIAAAYDRMAIMKRLILQGLDPEAINHRGETALHVAAKEGFKRSCSLLLSFNADIKAIDMRDNKPMDLALKYNHAKLSKWLENYQIKQEERLIKDNNETAISTI